MKVRREQQILVAGVMLLASWATATNSLWKATSGAGSVYVQGSIHMLSADDYPLDPAIEAAYSNATTLIFEVDLNESDSPEIARRMMSNAMLKPPETLKDQLSKKTYKRLKRAFEDAGSSVDLFKQMEPWLATMMLAVMEMQRMGLNPQMGMDKYFHRKATRDGKKVVGFESATFQIELLDSLGEENPEEFVAHSLDDLDMIEEELEKLLQAWRTGDLESLQKLMNESFFKEYPALYESFVTARNIRWAEQLKTHVQKGSPCMIVVGAAHLGGEKGLLKLLEQQGFKLEQL